MATTQKQVQAASAQRDADRMRMLAQAQERHGDIARRTGTIAPGRDENGALRETRKLESFPILVDKWYVRMSFKREDGAKLPDDWKRVELAVQSGSEERAPVKADAHIITAVRLLKHVREGYDAEVRQTETMLGTLDRINVRIAARDVGNDAVSAAIAQLREFDETKLSRKQVALKRIVARARLSQVVKTLENALTLQPGQREMEISRACAVLVSLRNRLGQWRDRQIAGIREYNLQKECALRVQRDKWLLARLEKFAESPVEIWEYEAFDRVKLETLVEAEEMIRAKAPREMVLSFLKARNTLFRVGDRERAHAEDKIALMERGVMPHAGRKVDYLIGHYGWLYRFVRAGETAKALAKIDYLGTFVSANKPGFIFRELSADPDPYLAEAINRLGTAVAAYNMYAMGTAKEHFAAARDGLKKFVSAGKS